MPLSNHQGWTVEDALNLLCAHSNSITKAEFFTIRSILQSKHKTGPVAAFWGHCWWENFPSLLGFSVTLTKDQKRYNFILMSALGSMVEGKEKKNFYMSGFLGSDRKTRSSVRHEYLDWKPTHSGALPWPAPWGRSADGGSAAECPHGLSELSAGHLWAETHTGSETLSAII